MRNVIAMILGGGRGTRLAPLTDERAKPAVPLAGKYRLVDVPLSNCIHNGIFRVFVLTQFESASLNRHITRTYHFDQFHEGAVDVLAAEERSKPDRGWFQGTADAVRQTLHHTTRWDAEHVLILSGDALYRMNFRDMFDLHMTKDADLTIACKTVDAQQATGFGIMQIDSENCITQFVEKPPMDDLPPLAMAEDVLEANGLSNANCPYLASMGIYIFKADLLKKLLVETEHDDFGKGIIPGLIDTGKVFAYPFSGYWEDVGTVRSYYEANLELTDDIPKFNLYIQDKPIFTRQRFLPASKLINTSAQRAIIAEGSIITGATINRAILGVRSIVREGSVLENAVMNGADFYDSEPSLEPNKPAKSHIPLGIGKNCVIRNAIIDKNVRIGNGVLIVNESNAQEADEPTHSIREGLVIVKKGAVIEDGTII
jgi:glucose-1-phosphate adenylyltransferase